MRGNRVKSEREERKKNREEVYCVLCLTDLTDQLILSYYFRLFPFSVPILSFSLITVPTLRV